ncbi:putative LRR containing protein [Trachipleistophora hominis]|uniref:Putative LRR containing protein n=1 Tax=Trachipleistophora hominis TaxID=72359 RepID=L7JZ70_TRAHO|nr:putative LRR containing protein [Trachipleistophora hominis]
MNCSSSRVTATLIKWILCFMGEKENVIGDISICDNLEDMNLESFFANPTVDEENLMLTELKINDYDAIEDPLKVFEPKEEQQSSVSPKIDSKDIHKFVRSANVNRYEYGDSSITENKNEFSSNRQIFARDRECKYRTIQIPVTKSLFMAVVILTVNSDVKFSNYELYIVVDRLLIFLHDKRPFLQVLAQQFLDDPKLSDKLDIIDKTSIKEEEKVGDNGEERNKSSGDISFNTKLQNAMCEVSNFIDVVTADIFGNAARVAQNNENRLVFSTDVESLFYFYKPRYLRMNGYFFINEKWFLCRMYDDVPSGFILTIDIDFTDVFDDVAKKHTSKRTRKRLITEKIDLALRFSFLRLRCLEVCIFRLKGVQIDLSFDTISNKQLHVYCKECVVSFSTHSSSNLKTLSIIDSKICCDLVLPDTLETFILEKTRIIVGYELRVTEICKHISINQNHGKIRIPYFEHTFSALLPSDGTFELLRSGDIIEKITLINVIFYDSVVTMPNNIQEIILKNIVLDGVGLWIFPEDIKKIALEKFSGHVQLDGFTQNKPLVGYFNDGTFRSYKSNESEQINELVFSRMHLTHDVYFNSNISKIVMSYVIMDLDFSFCFNEHIIEVSLYDCTCNLYLEGLPYLNQVQLENDSFGEPRRTFCFKRPDNQCIGQVSMSNLMIEETINFGPEIQDFKFNGITVSESSYVSFAENFNELELNDCKGRFKIPGIFSDDESHTIILGENVDLFKIRRTKNDSFDILIDTLSVDKLIIEMNLKTVELYDIKIVERVLITTHQCKNLIIGGFNCPLSIPNIVSLTKLELSDFDNLNISSKMFTLTKNVTAYVTPMNEDKNTGSPASDTNIYLPTIISDCCENIFISKNRIPINITGVLRNASINTSLMRLTPQSQFGIVTCPLKHLTKFELLDERICGIMIIEKDVCFLSLSRITSDEGSELWLNKGLESIRVDSSQININGSNAKNLRAITLVHSTAIIYDPSVHTSLSYLNICRMAINHSLILVPSIATFLLKHSTLISNCSVKINEEILELSISKFIGIIDMAGVAGLGKMEFDYECMLYFERSTSYNDGGLLHIEGYTFKNDITFSGDAKTIHLKHVKIVPNAKITLGHQCTSLALTSSNIDINFSRVNSLKKVTLASVSFAVLQKIFTNLSTIEVLILQDIALESSINLPNNMHTIVLREISLCAGSLLKFNAKCCKVHFYKCIGLYNFSNIERLLALSLITHFGDKLQFKVYLPSLRNLRRLDITYNLNNELFMFDLYGCINLEYLTVRSLNYSKEVTLYPPLSFSIYEVLDFSDTNTWSKYKPSKIKSRIGKFKNESVNILNLKANILISEIFTLKKRNKLKYLNLVGCSLDKENVEVLKELVNLRTLVIDSAFFESDLVKNIPRQIETLEIVDKKIFACQTLNLRRLNFKVVQELKKYENIKHLALDGSIMGYESIFDCLPINLESLKITRFSIGEVNFIEKNRTRVVIKQLILLLDDPNSHPPVLIDNNPMKRQYYKLFDYLKNFIDFNKLDDLMLEASGKFVSLDKETYRIN